MMRAYVEAAGLCGPGLAGWAASRPILAGETPYVPAAEIIPPCLLLPAAERRRAPKMVRLALAAGAEAFAAAGRDPAQTRAIFTSSGGDGETIHDILTMLATPARELSPTKFHNSVHNAAAGYWSIATGATTASTSLCAHDDSFAAGLLETMAQMTSAQAPAILIAYDLPYPAPLFSVRPVGCVFGTALLLSPVPSGASFATLDLTLQAACGAPTLCAPALEPLRLAAPAARALPVLESLAKNLASSVVLSYLEDMALHLTIAPFRVP